MSKTDSRFLLIDAQDPVNSCSRLIEGIYAKVSNTSQPYEVENKAFADADASSAFGEVLPSGVQKYAEKLDVKNASVLFDLGMGRGKLAIQMFLTHPNLKQVVGCELSPSRGATALQALRLLGKHQDGVFTTTESQNGAVVTLTTVPSDGKESRQLEFRMGNLFNATDALSADVVIMETAFHDNPSANHQLASFLSKCKKGMRLVTYVMNLDTRFMAAGMSFPFERILPRGPGDDDVCPASWSMGATFAFWRKIH